MCSGAPTCCVCVCFMSARGVGALEREFFVSMQTSTGMNSHVSDTVRVCVQSVTLRGIKAEARARIIMKIIIIRLQWGPLSSV